MSHVLLLIASAVAIYLACEWFVNAVEWLGLRLKVGKMAVGSVLAAVGTALPESIVTLVAVIGDASPERKEIGVGAAMGGPLVVGTLAYAVVGLMLIITVKNRRHSPPAAAAPAPADPLAGVDTRRLASDQRWFLAVFVFKVGLGLVAFAVKPWLGLLFFAVYGLYFWREMHADDTTGEDVDLEPLKLARKSSDPATWLVATQTLATLTVIFFASQIFVHQLDWAGPAIGLSPVVVALLLSPVATELPEIMNAVIWVRQGKTQLALANISGAMMIQATVPSGIGLLFTSWHFDTPLILAGIATTASIVYLQLTLRAGRLTPGRLLVPAVFYGLFALGLVVTA